MNVPNELPKIPTGVQGLDDILDGGFPQGRPTLVCGGAGCGKTLLAMEFIVRGAVEHGENGVFLAFEESTKDLVENVRSLGFDLPRLIDDKRVAVSYIHLDPSETEETGKYDLEGLFVRLAHAVKSVGAKRVALDTLETLFGGLKDQAVLRSELRRLFRWLKDQGLTAVITGERGDGTLTRQGLEEYVSDCVILLDHRVVEQVSTRRIRVVKYRGSTHGTNEYPFLIDESGISVLPITSLELTHEASPERVSSGVRALDAMLGGKGYFRDSTILVNGTAGCGKTSLAASFVDSACRRGERCLFFGFEESPGQLIRNMRSIGIDLQPWVDQGLLKFHANRSSTLGLEMHLATIHKQVLEHRPHVVVLDPISSLLSAGTTRDVTALLTRLIDFLKVNGITAMLTNLITGGEAAETSEVGISSIADVWIMLRDVESGGERNRCIYVLKARGMPHSNQIREFLLTPNGIDFREVYAGSGGVLTGSLRVAQEAREAEAEAARRDAAEARVRELARKREALEARIEALRKAFAAEEEESSRVAKREELRERSLDRERAAMAASRGSISRTGTGVVSGKENLK